MIPYALRSALVTTVGVAFAIASGSALATTYRLTDLGTDALEACLGARPTPLS